MFIPYEHLAVSLLYSFWRHTDPRDCPILETADLGRPILEALLIEAAQKIKTLRGSHVNLL